MLGEGALGVKDGAGGGNARLETLAEVLSSLMPLVRNVASDEW